MLSLCLIELCEVITGKCKPTEESKLRKLQMAFKEKIDEQTRSRAATSKSNIPWNSQQNEFDC